MISEGTYRMLGIELRTRHLSYLLYSISVPVPLSFEFSPHLLLLFSFLQLFLELTNFFSTELLLWCQSLYWVFCFTCWTLQFCHFWLQLSHFCPYGSCTLLITSAIVYLSSLNILYMLCLKYLSESWLVEPSRLLSSLTDIVEILCCFPVGNPLLQSGHASSWYSHSTAGISLTKSMSVPLFLPSWSYFIVIGTASPLPVI